MKIYACSLLMLVLSFSACTNPVPNLSGTYHGFWYETSFELTFSTNGEFTVETGGHFGQTTSHGEYTMLDTTVFLLPDSDDVLGFNFGDRISKLQYDVQTDCLTDFSDRLYCKDEKQWLKLGEERYEQRLKIEGHLLRLPEIEKYILTQTDTTVSFLLKPRIEFDLTRTLQQKHYWQYHLMVPNPDQTELSTSPLMRARMSPFLVDTKDLKIYREERSVDKPLLFVGQVLD